MDRDIALILTITIVLGITIIVICIQLFRIRPILLPATPVMGRKCFPFQGVKMSFFTTFPGMLVSRFAFLGRPILTGLRCLEIIDYGD